MTFSDEIFELLGELAAKQERTFFRKLIEGQVTKAGLREYYAHLYHECCSFVRLVSAVHAFAEERDQREALGHNLVDEYGHGEPGMDHPSLTLRISRSLGLTEDEVMAHGLYPEVKAEFERLRALAFSSFLEGLAVLVTIEADLPIRHRIMRQALIERYGMKPEDLAYYAEHMDGSDSVKAGGSYGGDDVHVGREVKLLEKYATTEADREKVRAAIRTAFDVRNRLIRVLDERCGAPA